METRTLYCNDCHRLFKFTAGEQNFYQKMKLATPCHCPECREKRRERYGDPNFGWAGTMCAPTHTKPGHTRVHYAPYVVGGLRG